MNPHRAARYYYLRFIRLKGDPKTLARGVAIGVFIGITPTIPLHTVLILLGCWLLSGNTVAGILSSVMVSNPLTIPFQYYLCWSIGNRLLPGHISWSRIQELLILFRSDAGFSECLAALFHMSSDALLVMNTGGLLLALPCAAASYIASLRFFTFIHRKRMDRHILRSP